MRKLRNISGLGLALGLMLVLGGCALDEEEVLRDRLTAWLHLGETRHFNSSSQCTVAVFRLENLVWKRGSPQQIGDINLALAAIEGDLPVRFHAPGKSPDVVSREIMTRDLARGIGLISSGISPAQACMEDWVARGTLTALTSPESEMVYAPAENALLVIYRPQAYAIYLRGTL